MTTPWQPDAHTVPSPLPPLGVGALIKQTFRLLFTRFGTLFPLAFVPALVLAILDWGTAAPLPASFDPGIDQMPMPSTGEILVGLASTIVGFFIIGIMCLAALDAVMGRTHTLNQYTKQALRQILPIGVLGFLLSVIGAIGLVFFIVPGLYVAARFLPWVEAVVFEDAGWSGLSRAQTLTEGYRWPLVSAVLLMTLAIIALILAASPLLLALQGYGIVAAVVQAAVSAFYYALIAIFTALTYARLREVKEGMTIAQIADTIG